MIHKKNSKESFPDDFWKALSNRVWSVKQYHATDEIEIIHIAPGEIDNCYHRPLFIEMVDRCESPVVLRKVSCGTYVTLWGFGLVDRAIELHVEHVEAQVIYVDDTEGELYSYKRAYSVAVGSVGSMVARNRLIYEWILSGKTRKERAEIRKRIMEETGLTEQRVSNIWRVFTLTIPEVVDELMNGLSVSKAIPLCKKSEAIQRAVLPFVLQEGSHPDAISEMIIELERTFQSKNKMTYSEYEDHSFIYEKDMYPIIAEFFEETYGITFHRIDKDVTWSYRSRPHRVDWLGLREEDFPVFWSCEVKLSIKDIVGLIKQAEHTFRICNKAWIALPTSEIPESTEERNAFYLKLREKGLGLLSVNTEGRDVIELIVPQENERIELTTYIDMLVKVEHVDSLQSSIDRRSFASRYW